MFVPKGLINKIPALFQMMAWRLPADKPLSEPMQTCKAQQVCGLAQLQKWCISVMLKLMSFVLNFTVEKNLPQIHWTSFQFYLPRPLASCGLYQAMDILSVIVTVIPFCSDNNIIDATIFFNV